MSNVNDYVYAFNSAAWPTVTFTVPKTRGQEIAESVRVEVDLSDAKRDLAAAIDDAIEQPRKEEHEPDPSPDLSLITKYPAGTTREAIEFANGLVGQSGPADEDGENFLTVGGWWVGGSQPDSDTRFEIEAVRKSLAAAFDAATEETEERELKEKINLLEKQVEDWKANARKWQDWI